MVELRRSSVLVLGVFIVTSCGGAGPAGSPSPMASVGARPPVQATITTRVDFSKEPFGGTFEVTLGSDELGCTAGTFVDAEAPNGIDKTITCTTGGTGTFSIRARTMTLGCEPGPPEECLGSWTVHTPHPTGAFVGLQGFGEFKVTFDEPNSAKETITGEFRFG